MPLSFESLSHGNVAFGFFNIDSDMLLLEEYFFFADDFCRRISDITESETQACACMFLPVYTIEKSEDIGNLMNAIYGIEYTGFIGEVYRRFPFPQKEEDFKQKPEVSGTREIVKSLISGYSKVAEIPFIFKEGGEGVIGRYEFSRDSFQKLIEYVWMGGYPLWKDGRRPDYVSAMKNKIERSRRPLFEGIVFED